MINFMIQFDSIDGSKDRELEKSEFMYNEVFKRMLDP